MFSMNDFLRNFLMSRVILQKSSFLLKICFPLSNLFVKISNADPLKQPLQSAALFVPSPVHCIMLFLRFYPDFVRCHDARRHRFFSRDSFRFEQLPYLLFRCSCVFTHFRCFVHSTIPPIVLSVISPYILLGFIVIIFYPFIRALSILISNFLLTF